MRRLLLPVLLALSLAQPARPASPPEPWRKGASALHQWPVATATMRPWTRWWWLGSGVDEPNLKLMLRQFHDEGLGGVEICPIYGAKGYENRFIPYLSPQWMDLFAVTTSTARGLGLGVDLTTGTGWPMGGPWITDDQASENVTIQRYAFGSDGRMSTAIGPVTGAAPRPAQQAGTSGAMDGLVTVAAHNPVVCAEAVGPDGKAVDVSAQIKTSRLDWTAPGPGWKLYVARGRQPIQKVKRSAPGDEGNVIDPFSISALDLFLHRFDQGFQLYRGAPPRSEFHDSFEYFGANWTPRFLTEFQRRRGYDLRLQLAALAGDGDREVAARVREDYRRTLGELHREWVEHWTQWSHGHGSLTREQAHGAPANIEDVYAAADIPETEGSFGGGGFDQIPMLQFASSAAHVTGRTLASSETFTWLGEHFSVPLASMKPIADTFFLAGINHIFFHGTPYSPSDAPWPGWLFYASVNFGPNGGIFHDLPAFNAYATRCQSILQGGKPDNDVLLYFPVADFWQQAGNPAESKDPRRRARPDPLVEQFTTPGQWMKDSPFHAAAMQLWNAGYSYDEVTDDLLASARPAGSGVELGGNHYRAVLIPDCKVMPLATAQLLAKLARAGATILFEGAVPSQVPGLTAFTEQEAQLKALVGAEFPPNWRIGANLPELMLEGGVTPERMTESGLQCIRRRRPDGIDYFVVNLGKQTVDQWVPFNSPLQSAVLLDPLYPDKTGYAAVRPGSDGGSVYLQLAPGQSMIVRLAGKPSAPNQRLVGAGERSEPTRPEVALHPSSLSWTYNRPGANSRELTGDWKVHFVAGGPVLPADFTSAAPAAWTGRHDADADRFAGTAVYSTEFKVDAALAKAGHCRLDLGQVAESARVRVNGHAVTTLWCAPFAADVGPWLVAGENQLEIEVTNVAANRIADLDRRKVNWKSFYEINFVNRKYEPFDASDWPVRPSGLLGPVTLTELETFRP